MNAFPILSPPLSHGEAFPGSGFQECCRFCFFLVLFFWFLPLSHGAACPESGFQECCHGGTLRPASGFLLLLWPPLQMLCRNHMVTCLRIFFVQNPDIFLYVVRDSKTFLCYLSSMAVKVSGRFQSSCPLDITTVFVADAPDPGLDGTVERRM